LSEAAKKRVALISKEFTEGFEFIKNYPRSVTFFGSARTKEGEHDYERARNLAKRIVEELHYSVLTGGGPGIMEAANRGAYEAGGNSLGLNIGLPHEQLSNKYLTHEIGFHYFFSRKVCLSFSAEAYVFFPGGFGTLDEFLEILTLVQTNKIPKVPIILFGESYWKPLEEFFKKNLLPGNMIEETDLNLYLITDDEDKMLDTIRHAPVRIGLKYDEKSEDPQRSNGKKGNAEGPLTSLSEKHCIPCEGGVPTLTDVEIAKLLPQISGWSVVPVHIEGVFGKGQAYAASAAAAVGIGAYSLSKRTITLDIEAEKIVSALHEMRNKSKIRTGCFGIAFNYAIRFTLCDRSFILD